MSTVITFWLLLFCILFTSFTEVLCLQCYTCISMNCWGNDDCESTVPHVLDVAKPLYNIQNSMTTCPVQHSVEVSWLSVANQCREKRKGDATCALGRIKVDISEKSNGKRVSYFGSITGCATEELLRRSRDAFTKNLCDIRVKNIEDNERTIKISVEHCHRIQTMCHQLDRCITPAMTEVKEWSTSEDEGFQPKHLYLIGGLLLLAILYLALVLCGLLKR